MVEDNCPGENGYCLTSKGFDQNNGVIKLNSLDSNTRERKLNCLKLCRALSNAIGCEVIWGQSNRGCYAHTQNIATGNGVDRHHCWMFSKCEAGLK